MAHFPAVLNPSEDDMQKMLACQVHLGTKTCDAAMEPYIWGRRSDGVFIINLQKTWEKLVLAARLIAAIENPSDVVVVSARTFGQRAVLKFAKYCKAQAIAGRYTPGTFTNQITKKFMEPRMLIATDPRTDHQAIHESSYCNLPVIALAHTDSPLRYVDVAIPCNNKARTATGLMYWLLTREVLRLRNAIPRGVAWEIMPDLYFYRDVDEQEKQEELANEWPQAADASAVVPAAEFAPVDGAAPAAEWGAEPTPATAPAANTWDSAMPQAMSSSWENAGPQ